MKKSVFIFLLISTWIFSCNNSPQTKNEKSDSAKVQTPIPVDTLVPEKMEEGKMIGQYVFYYGNWGYELRIGKKRTIELTFDGDTENTIWKGKWMIKNDTLIAKYTSCIDREVQFSFRNGKEIEKHQDYRGEVQPNDSIDKFIVVKDHLVRLDHIDTTFFPEVFQIDSTNFQPPNPNDTLIPETMTANKIIGVYVFYYGNWGYDLEITKKKIGMRMSMPDTLDEGRIGTWRIKDDTLIAKWHSCSGGTGGPGMMILQEDSTGKRDTLPQDYYYSMDWEIKLMDKVISQKDGEIIPGDEQIEKFILVNGILVDLDGIDSGDLFPEELTRVR